MKKEAMFFALLLAGGFCFAQTDESYARVNSMLRYGGLNKNFFAIQQEASNLDEAQRLRLYNAYNMGSEDMWIGAALDFFGGFSVGNFYQRDYLGGGIALGGGLVGLGLFIGGYAVMFNSLYVTATNGSSGNVYDYDMIERGLPFCISGAVIFLTSETFGLIRTFVFPSAYNKKLRSALNIQGLAMNIEPSLNITGSEYELTLVHFRY